MKILLKNSDKYSIEINLSNIDRIYNPSDNKYTLVFFKQNVNWLYKGKPSYLTKAAAVLESPKEIERLIEIAKYNESFERMLS